MENLEPIKNETKIDLDNVAKEYAENLRKYFQEQKEKEIRSDAHFQRINPEELTYDDLMIYDKFRNGTLTKDEFGNYRERLRDYFQEQMIKRRSEFDLMADSRSNFSAMILNKLLVQEIIKRHPENPVP